jgi:hypothetical protein
MSPRRSPTFTRPDYYTPHYCEENVWHLIQDSGVTANELYAMFISNARKACPMWQQRAAPRPQEPVVWDYHVVVLGRKQHWEVWDLDTVLPTPVSARTYLASTFSSEASLPKDLRTYFRVVPRDQYLAYFASDRSHMKRPDGSWMAPPPSRSPIRTTTEVMNLFRFVDMAKVFLGEVYDLNGLLSFIDRKA